MKNNNRLFLDVHAIQTMPPSNVNRDDTGSPKSAQYGGVRRARVSSQSWKRAIRKYFNDNSGHSNVGVRSLNIVDYIANKIVLQDSSYDEETALEKANAVLNKAGVKTKDKKARALFFLGDRQADALAQAAIEGIDNKKQLQTILKDNPAVDIALFGRMVADDPSLNEDASSQVAHAISTHAVQTEFDFYTAVDDLAPENNAGAGMLGTIEFNSSTLYRYANVAVHELYRQLGSKEAAIHALTLFVESFTNSLPTGKVNTFANQTIPNALLVTLRQDRPVNLVNAFEEPVRSTQGYVEKSIVRLFQEHSKVAKIVDEPLISLYLTLDTLNFDGEVGKEKESLKNLIDDLSRQLETSIIEI